ncbi:MAG TPA: alpha/beta hydrolase, partial [Gemmatales bacterium]|nr:alpha/beta hydrolase [Gemmatales bacterium]
MGYARWRLLTVCSSLFLVAWLTSGPAAAQRSAGKALPEGRSTRVVRDVVYYSGPDADPVKHQLDMYLPQERTGFPVVLFVHGGGWRHGDKRMLFDLHAKIGERFVRQGIGFIAVNYRLSPKVQHPEHAKDVARAVAWTVKHLADYGGDARQLYLCGHSAGGHLVSLLATDERFLAAEGVNLADLRGVVAVSGVYEVLPQESFFPSVFGKDPEARRQASPLAHVKPDRPPFLILYADDDYLGLDRMAERFGKELRRYGNEAAVEEIKQRDHLTIIGRMLTADDPTLQAIVKFVARHAHTPL